MRRALQAVMFVVAVVALAAVARAQEVHRPGNGVTLPKLVKQVSAAYTQEARDAHIEGTVLLECVVRENGKVTDVKVVRSLDPTYGLDKQAVKAVEQWEFEPGKKDDRPVPVQISIEINFTLK